MTQKIILDQGWWLKPAQDSLEESRKILFRDKILAKVPGCIHSDLLRANLIPDPFYADNEMMLDWICEADWIYSTHFDLPADISETKNLQLVCEGLDTIARVFLNGELLGQTENMFRCYQFPLKGIILEKKNKLTIHFCSPKRYGRQMEKKYGKKQVALVSERVYLRKAQYSFGWDWGPAFPTMGIWKPIYLKNPAQTYFKNIRFHTPHISEQQAEILLELEIGGVPKDCMVNIEMQDEYQTRQIEAKLTKSKCNQIQFTLQNPVLWWPNGEGEPHLYDLKISLKTLRGKLLDQRLLKVGIRSVTLQLKDKAKSDFRFIINGREVYMKGANWIPADSFLDRIKTDTYRQLIQSAKDSNMNMFRVWGGGIYENDTFYNVCDELGILVWQDFMFACGVYPSHLEFIENIKEEFKENINRLQSHPCLALWCGNNENDWGWYVQEKKPLEEMPDYKIYHKILPDLLGRLDPLRPYWPSSPFGMDEDPNAPGSGNQHQWDIWSGWEDYTDVRRDQSLFVSEFGFQGPANRKTLEKVIPNAKRYPQSTLFEFHNKQVEGNERIFRFLAGHLPIRNNWEDFLYLAQLNQGLAFKYCIEHWRLRWPSTAGSIIWQLNDCWPVVSWSLIDSDLQPKLAYHLVREAFNPILIGFKTWNDNIDIIGLNSTQKKFKGKLRINIWESKTWENVHTENIQLTIKSNLVRKIYSISLLKKMEDNNGIIVTTLLDESGRQIHRNVISQNRWKHMNLPKANVNITLKDGPEEKKCSLTTDLPAFFIDLYHSNFNFSNRGFTLLPDERLEISVTGDSVKNSHLEEVQILMLNNYSEA